jgi:hypothetical protein
MNRSINNGGLDVPRTRIGLTIAALLLLPFAVACGGQKEAAAILAPLDAHNFGDSAHITNNWLPYQVGSKYVYQGQIRNIPQVVETLVTQETRNIAGVEARVIWDRDIDNGQLVEETRDYVAQDKQGNVWYMGETTTHYVNGQLTDHADTWVAGEKGAKAGILMPANPKVASRPYQTEYAKNVAEDRVRVMAMNQSVCTPLKCFQGALKVEDTSPLDPGAIEHKFYVPGVGLVKSIIVQGDTEESNLVSVTPAPARL